MEKKSPLAGAKVASVLDPARVVINRGSENGVQVGQRFIIFTIGQELTDPDTKQSLGKLEIVRGTGKVEHIQERMAILKSDRTTTRRIRSRNPIAVFGVDLDETVTEQLSFEDPEVGDLAKPL